MLPASHGGTAMKWIRLIIVALGGIIAVLIFFVVIGVPAQVVASSLSKQLEASTGLRLKNIGFAKLAILPELGLTLEDVSVEDAASGQPVFSTRRARAGKPAERTDPHHRHRDQRVDRFRGKLAGRTIGAPTGPAAEPRRGG